MRLHNAELVFSNAVVAAVLEHLIHHVFWNINKRNLLFDADLADNVSGDVGMEGDLPHNVIRADVMCLAFVDLTPHHAFFMSAAAFDS